MAILLSFAGFLSRFTDPACHRIRLKFCALCDSVLDSLDNLAIRRDSIARQNILEVVLEWIQDPSQVCRPPRRERRLTVISQIPDNDPCQQLELNIAALRSCVRLLDRLQLQPLEAAGEDANHVLSRLFIRYQKLGFKLLEHGSQVTNFLFVIFSDISAKPLSSQMLMKILKSLLRHRQAFPYPLPSNIEHILPEISSCGKGSRNS